MTKKPAAAVIKFDPDSGGWFPVTHVVKDDPGVGDVHISNAGGDGKGRKRRKKPKSFDEVMVAKRDGVADDAAEWGCDFEIAKTDDAQNLVFGWANIVEKDGVVVTDSQGDQIEIGELEKAVYDYVLFAREAGEMHERTTGVGKVVESIVMTVEKQKALGIPEGSTPIGWFVGFKLEPDVFKSVRDGKYPMFSIGGSARREEI